MPPLVPRKELRPPLNEFSTLSFSRLPFFCCFPIFFLSISGISLFCSSGLKCLRIGSMVTNDSRSRLPCNGPLLYIAIAFSSQRCEVVRLLQPGSGAEKRHFFEKKRKKWRSSFLVVLLFFSATVASTAVSSFPVSVWV